MNTTSFRAKRLGANALAILGLITLNPGLRAQPVVTYTVSGQPGFYTLDFTVDNMTPGSQGFDIYMLSVLTDGPDSSAPSGYSMMTYNNLSYWVVGTTQYGPFKNLWIDPSYTKLPTGSILSGFELRVPDTTAPASVPYFAWGTANNGLPYTGPGNFNLGNPSNPFFIGNALEVAPVPEPATLSLIAVASLPLLFGRRRGLTTRRS